MLTDDKRAAMLAQTGPVLAVALCEATGDGWTYIPGMAPDFGILARRKDGMQLGVRPGWFDGAVRYEFMPHLQADGRAPVPAAQDQTASRPALRIQSTTTRGIEAVAADVARRLVEPYEAQYRNTLARAIEGLPGRDAQRQVADLLAWLTGGAQAWREGDISLHPDVGGTSLPLRVAPGGTIELGHASVSADQVADLVAGLLRAGRMRPASEAV